MSLMALGPATSHGPLRTLGLVNGVRDILQSPDCPLLKEPCEEANPGEPSVTRSRTQRQRASSKCCSGSESENYSGDRINKPINRVVLRKLVLKDVPAHVVDRISTASQPTPKNHISGDVDEAYVSQPPDVQEPNEDSGQQGDEYPHMQP